MAKKMNAAGHTVLLAMGGNLPSVSGSGALETQRQAVQEMERVEINITAISNVYQTKPYPPSGQPDFINVVLQAQTWLTPYQVLKRCLAIEKRLGRKREERWSARTLDIDVIAYDDLVLPDREAWWAVVNHEDPTFLVEKLMLPHPRAHFRGFVLVPLCDLASEWVHPILQKTAKELMEEQKARGNLTGITRLNEQLVPLHQQARPV